MQMWCVRNGIPYDIAYVLTEAELLAHCVTFSQFELGPKHEFDWKDLRFKER